MESEDRRHRMQDDRRARRRGGRRESDAKKPWYMRRRVWLAAASVAYVGWRRLRRLGRSNDASKRHVAA
jgi:hypothetical protein